MVKRNTLLLDSRKGLQTFNSVLIWKDYSETKSSSVLLAFRPHYIQISVAPLFDLPLVERREPCTA
jgi:hypothetical protein